METSKRGRKPLQHKVNMVYVRLNNEELSMLDIATHRTFTTRSSCLRRALHEFLKREGIKKEE